MLFVMLFVMLFKRVRQFLRFKLLPVQYNVILSRISGLCISSTECTRVINDYLKTVLLKTGFKFNKISSLDCKKCCHSLKYANDQ